MAATVWVALLRGINVGGHRKLPMADLRGLLEGLGYTDVATYIQSGNAVFTADAAEAVIVDAISVAILDRFEFEVPVIVRTSTEFASLAATHPLCGDEPDVAKLHVMFFDVAPEPGRLAQLDAASFVPDEAELDGRELYIHYAGGAGRSRLTTDAVERALARTATARNWRTVQRLAELAAAVGG